MGFYKAPGRSGWLSLCGPASPCDVGGQPARISSILTRMLSIFNFCSLVVLEILDGALVSFRSFSGAERTKISSTAGFGILLARIETVFAGLQFTNHQATSITFDGINQHEVNRVFGKSSLPGVWHTCNDGREKTVRRAVLSANDPPPGSRRHACDRGGFHFQL